MVLSTVDIEGTAGLPRSLARDRRLPAHPAARLQAPRDRAAPRPDRPAQRGGRAGVPRDVRREPARRAAGRQGPARAARAPRDAQRADLRDRRQRPRGRRAREGGRGRRGRADGQRGRVGAAGLGRGAAPGRQLGARRGLSSCADAFGTDPSGRHANMCSLMEYVELHCHSAFSFLDGASSPDELVAAALERGHTRAGADRPRHGLGLDGVRPGRGGARAAGDPRARRSRCAARAAARPPPDAAGPRRHGLAQPLPAADARPRPHARVRGESVPAQRAGCAAARAPAGRPRGTSAPR